ncbi:TolC family protein, partial [bacterium]|nr:TolC family protein [bacterium]
PLLRGAGRHIEGEPLTQAERNVVYAIYNFERYKRTFAVNVARDYFSVLQVIDQIKNSEENYRSLITSTRRARLWAEAGKVSPVDVDQSIQQELEARNRWIREKIGFERTMDSFKMMLGLPPDAQIELDRNEMDKISASVESIIEFETPKKPTEDVPAADADIVLQPPTMKGAGPYELDSLKAMKIALDNRLDFRVVRLQVEDAQRNVVVAADSLRAELTLFGNAGFGEGRSLGSAALPPHESLRLDKGNYNALLSLDLPIERTSEMMAYRRSIIGLEQAVRDFQDFEDTIKLNIRNKLRDLQEARQSLQIQAQAVELAKQRVESTNLSLEAGRAIIRDLLEAQQALLSSQNSFTGEKIDYRLGELELQRDLGVLEVNEKGLWTELKPEELDNGSQ